MPMQRFVLSALFCCPFLAVGVTNVGCHTHDREVEVRHDDHWDRDHVDDHHDMDHHDVDHHDMDDHH